MKLVILDDWEYTFATNPLLNQLKGYFDITVYHDKPEQIELIKRIQEADVIIPIRERTRFTKQVLQEMKKIKLIAQTGGGVAHIDMSEANRLRIPIATTAGGSRAVVELIFGFILAFSRKLVTLDRQVKSGEWPEILGTSLENKTIGIIGLGNIGNGVATIAKAFGMRVIAWSPRLTQERTMAEGVEYKTLVELLQQAHYISINLRLVPETRSLLRKEHFELMRRDAFLINTSRGEIIDENALCEALEQKKIAGAGLDVFTHEPIPSDHPLLHFENVILSPHIGWKTDLMLQHFLEQAIENIISNIVHQNPRNIINL